MPGVVEKPDVLLVTRREAARMLGISDRSLYQLTKGGRIPCIRLNLRSVRYSVKQLESFIEQELFAT